MYGYFNYIIFPVIKEVGLEMKIMAMIYMFVLEKQKRNVKFYLEGLKREVLILDYSNFFL